MEQTVWFGSHGTYRPTNTMSRLCRRKLGRQIAEIDAVAGQTEARQAHARSMSSADASGSDASSEESATRCWPPEETSSSAAAAEPAGVRLG